MREVQEFIELKSEPLDGEELISVPEGFDTKMKVKECHLKVECNNKSGLEEAYSKESSELHSKVHVVSNNESAQIEEMEVQNYDSHEKQISFPETLTFKLDTFDPKSESPNQVFHEFDNKIGITDNYLKFEPNNSSDSTDTNSAKAMECCPELNFKGISTDKKSKNETLPTKFDIFNTKSELPDEVFNEFDHKIEITDNNYLKFEPDNIDSIDTNSMKVVESSKLNFKSVSTDKEINSNSSQKKKSGKDLATDPPLILERFDANLTQISDNGGLNKERIKQRSSLKNSKVCKMNRENSEKLEYYKKCSSRTKRMKILKTHLTVNMKPEHIEMLKCTKCSYRTKNKSDFTRHIKIHMDPKDIEMFQCSVCFYKSKQKHHLNRHMKTHMNPEDIEMFECNKCSYRSKYKGSINTHLNIHMNPKDIEMFQCSECFFKSKRKCNLIRHIKIHMKPEHIEMFECNKCSYRFKQKYELIRHMKIHMKPEDIKMFECSECCYKTKYKPNLYNHKKVHMKPEDLEMFECNECSYKTKYKQNLYHHKKVHMKPQDFEIFECNKCSFRTKSKKRIITHMKVHMNKTRGNIRLKTLKCTQIAV